MKIIESRAKAELRRFLKEKSSQVINREEKTQDLHKRLIEFFQATQGQKEENEEFWGLYSGLSDEISLQGLFTSWALNHPFLRWVYPKVETGDNEALTFWLPGPKGFEKNKWGILEPVEEEGLKVPLNKIKGFIVPGMGFDEEGRRLGRGKGFYDRTLSLFSGIKVGVTFEELLQNEIPVEKHDVKVGFIVTERRVRRI